MTVFISYSSQDFHEPRLEGTSVPGKIKEAIEKTRTEERNSCENMISQTNQKSNDKTIKTIKKYETIKSNLSKTDLNQRTRLLQQLEDFNFAD